MPNEKNNNDEFEFSGFATNESFEVPDDEIPNVTKRKKDNDDPVNQMFKEALNGLDFDFSGINTDDLKNSLSDNIKMQLEDLSASLGKSEDDILTSAMDMVMNLLSGNKDTTNALAGMLTDIVNEDEDDDCNEDCIHCSHNGDCPDAHFRYELSDRKYLNSEDFGCLECISDINLYSAFKEKYGDDSSKYLDSAEGIKNVQCNELTSQLPLNEVKELKYIDSTDKFILFFAVIPNEEEYGFYVAVYREPSGEYVLYIPSYRNTFNVYKDESGNEVAELFKPDELPAFFYKGKDGTPQFAALDMYLLEMGINFSLVPKANPITSPHDFGTIKNIQASPTRPSSMLQIGNIESNESSKAILLKKDAELDLNQTVFPLYVMFSRKMDENELNAFSEIFFKVDFNSCKLLDNVELCFTPYHELYFKLDLGEF